MARPALLTPEQKKERATANRKAFRAKNPHKRHEYYLREKAKRPVYVRPTPLERLLARTDKTDTCWLWRGAVQYSGHGHIRANGKVVYTHRLAYEQLVGPIPEGKELHHLCEVPNCVRPDHLKPVTRKEHHTYGWRQKAASKVHVKVAQAAARKKQLAKTTCKRGHPFYTSNDGRRRCRECSKIHQANNSRNRK